MTIPIRAVKRLLKKPVLWLLAALQKDVQANWQVGRSGVGAPGAYDPGFRRRRGVRP